MRSYFILICAFAFLLSDNSNAKSLSSLLFGKGHHSSGDHGSRKKHSQKGVTVDSRLVDPSRGNNQIDTFSDSKKKLAKYVYGHNGETIYCGCSFSGKVVNIRGCVNVIHNAKRASRLEWEHQLPFENFARFRASYSSQCEGQKNKRKCATDRDLLLSRMESDMYNLVPAEGEVNGLRSNFDYAMLSRSKYDFGSCKSKLDGKEFEPRNEAKGQVARSSLYMAWAYEGVLNLSDKQRKLFEAWNRMYPPSKEECRLAKLKEKQQGNKNPLVKCERI